MAWQAPEATDYLQSSRNGVHPPLSAIQARDYGFAARAGRYPS
jgi:hypothetical protein